MRITPGQQVGSYVVESRLGAGGTAEVWRVRHHLLGREYALKVLMRNSAEQTHRLLAEGRAQAKLRHPNLLPVTDVVSLEGAIGLVMPLVEGPSLDRFLQAYRPNESEAITLFRAITEGVAHAHEHGLIHRDLKPANVLLEERHGRWVPRVSDFGLVKHTGQVGLTQTGMMMGTLHYAAPEQILDAASVDQRADLFSLGVVLVELLSGQRPFQGFSLGSVLKAHITGPNLNEVPASWRPLCASLLMFSADDRLDSCAALLAALDQLLPPGQLTPLAVAGQAAEALQSLMTEERTMTAVLSPADQPSQQLHNLNAELDPFVGRTRALAQLSDAFLGGRLVSVLGTGGTGKTRLVLQFARQNLDMYPGGVWFCDLSEAHTREAFASVVAQGLRLTLSEGEPMATLEHAIVGRGQCLVILDNFEQIVSESAVVAGWVERAVQARFLVTSRIRLGLPDEQVLALSPLSEADAVALFITRAQAKDATFVPDNIQELETLVGLLDCLPLAIELAAGRIRMMQPSQLIYWMKQRFRLLSDERPGTSRRQATMRAAIDWSWEMLEGWEKLAFAQCSVFEGGFTLAAAEAVVDLSAFPDAPWLLDVVQSLVDRSLIRPILDHRLPQRRFGMLLSLQEYGRIKLRERGEEAEAMYRHAVYFAQFGKDDALNDPRMRCDVSLWRARAAELDNLFSAAANVTDRAPELPALAALAAAAFFPRRLSSVVGHRLLTRALAGIEAQQGTRWTSLRVRLMRRLGWLEHFMGKGDAARDRLEAVVELAQTSNEPIIESRAAVNLGAVYFTQRQFEEAAAYFRRGLALSRAHNDPWNELIALMNWGVMMFSQGKQAEGRGMLEDALAIARSTGDLQSSGQVLSNLGSMWFATGQREQAKRHYTESLEIFEALGRKREMAIMNLNLGNISEGRRKFDTAARQFERAVMLNRQIGNRQREVYALAALGRLSKDQGHFSEALRHFEETLQVYRQISHLGDRGDVLQEMGEIHLLQGDVEVSRLRFTQAIAISLKTKANEDTIVGLVRLGRLEAITGQLENAEAHYREAMMYTEKSSRPDEEAMVLGYIGELAALRGDLSTAMTHLHAGEALFREHAPTARSFIMLLCQLGNTALLAGDTATARASLDETHRITEVQVCSLPIELTHSVEELQARVETSNIPAGAPGAVGTRHRA
ncbi:MAG: putative ATPase, partial [Myxococcota bacterium]